MSKFVIVEGNILLLDDNGNIAKIQSNAEGGVNRLQTQSSIVGADGNPIQSENKYDGQTQGLHTISEVDNSDFNRVPIKHVRDQVDVLNRVKVSTPTILFESSHVVDKDPDLWSEMVQGSASSTHQGNISSVSMTTTTASGDRVWRKSRIRVPYFKGKAQEFMATGNFKGSQSGVTKRLGLFDQRNGVFFQAKNGDFSVVRRSNTSGSVVEDEVVQGNWNIDTLDGTGDANNPSGIQLDITKQHLFVIEYLWLGSGIIRYGIYLDGQIIYVHSIDTTNSLDVPWAQAGNLPVSVEIENTVTTAQTNELVFTCSSVMSEGALENFGRTRVTDNGVTGVDVRSTPIAAIGIRINPNILNATLGFLNFFAAGIAGISPGYWRIILNPTLSSPAWVNADRGIAQVLSNTPSYTEGTGIVIGSGYLGDKKGIRSDSSRLDPVKGDFLLGYDVKGNPDTVALIIRLISGRTGTVLTSSRYKEYI